jgi:hypothetical protein
MMLARVSKTQAHVSTKITSAALKKQEKAEHEVTLESALQWKPG